MHAAILKQKLYRLALRMNPQPATFNIRTAIAGNSSATDDGADTFTAYSLNRVTYTDDLTSAEMLVAQSNLADVWRSFMLYQADLDQARAPQPVPLHTLSFSDGTTWLIERVNGTALNQAWRCLARKEH